MTTQPAAEPVVQVEVLDPDSPRGRAAAEGLSEVLGDVRLRLQREGVPIPDVAHSH
jgi:hypothetical protein